MIGTLSRNENRAAAARDRPSIIPAAMVAPGAGDAREDRDGLRRADHGDVAHAEGVLATARVEVAFLGVERPQRFVELDGSPPAAQQLGRRSAGRR